MELQFSKTDLGRLVRGDWELVCGRWEQADRIGKWLTIKSDGLYLNDCEKAPKPWVHPGREGLVLPLPTFTLEQFKAFCDWHPTFEWEAIESVFTNDDGTLDEGALKELASRGEAAAAMVCGVLAGADDEYLTAWETSCQIDECRAEIAELKSLKPTTITERAIAKQELEKLESRLTALLNPDAEPSTTESLEPAVPAQQQPEPAAVEASPVQPQAAPPAPVVADSASTAPDWTVRKPQRYNGYAAPLHRLLAAAHRDGNPCPTARDVVEAWRNNAPAEIAKVLPDGFDYYDAKGNTKTADLEAIRKAIGRMKIAR
ncbi:hypothetical protein BDD18_0685 [Acidovorax temperans]|uniref:Uncharacterized protein n=1 Tax=Acidovorax temperans TaxID=80878 RepID=A0A543LJH8_9BURK|nr:hypothetical protein [Acidovorax temperans]TQN07553.1 hypothetical protein BDD18_0685 [Acidovorax temperans]